MIAILRFLAELFGWLTFLAIGVASTYLVMVEGWKSVSQSWRELMR